MRFATMFKVIAVSLLTSATFLSGVSWERYALQPARMKMKRDALAAKIKQAKSGPKKPCVPCSKKTTATDAL